MRRSFNAVTISSVTRMLTRRWASRSTFGFHNANDPARRLLAESRTRGEEEEEEDDGASSRRLARLAGETDLRVVVTCARVASAGDARSGASALRRGRALEKAVRDAGLRVGAVTLVETAVEEE